jgi:hypothetical protein
VHRGIDIGTTKTAAVIVDRERRLRADGALDAPAAADLLAACRRAVAARAGDMNQHTETFPMCSTRARLVDRSDNGCRVA